MLFGQLFLTNDSFLEKRHILPRYRTRPWLISVLQGLSAAKENRPILWNTDAKLKKKKKKHCICQLWNTIFLEDFWPPHCVLLHPNGPCSQMKGSCQMPHYQTPESGKSRVIRPMDVPGKLLDNPVSNQLRNWLGGAGEHH